MKRFLSRAVLLVALAMVSASGFAAGLTAHAKNKVIDAVLRGQALGAPATLYLRVNNTTCTATTSGTEVTGLGYSRVAITGSLANWAGTQGAGTTTASSGTGGATSNNNTITLPTPGVGGWGQAQSLELMDAPSGGNSWFCGNLNVAKTINEGDDPKFQAGSLTFTLN